ncbi:hypothetical protein [Microbacterium sp. NPDC055683]
MSYASPPPAYPVRAPRPPAPTGLGVVALAAAVAGVVIGSVAVYAGAQGFADIGGLVDETGDIPDESAGAFLSVFLRAFGWLGAGFALWGLLATWGLVQGIVAIVLHRGRGAGIAALVVAVLGFFVVMAFFAIGMTAGLGSLVPDAVDAAVA